MPNPRRFAAERRSFQGELTTNGADLRSYPV
jgi:hypothetical protein